MRGPILEAAMGARNRVGKSGNQVGPKVGTEWNRVAHCHETSILEAGIDFSSSTCALSLFQVYHL